MEYIISVILVLLLEANASVDSIVHLISPSYVKKSSNLSLNCTSNVKPIGQTAEFLVNGKTYTSLRYDDGKCYSTVIRSVCKVVDCQCLEEGKSYILVHNASLPGDEITYTCDMTMPFARASSSASRRVRVIDLEGPFVKTNKEFPLDDGSVVQLTCLVETKFLMNLTWNCVDIYKLVQYKSNSSTIWTTIEFTTVETDNDRKCTCTAEYGDFTTTASINLIVTSKPMLKVNDNLMCNNSKPPILSCGILGNPSHYGFRPWIHIYDGIFIRELNGVYLDKMSYLLLNSCKYDDSGNYTCSAYIDTDDGRIWTNQTTYLGFAGPPIIVKTDMLVQPKPKFLVYFYSYQVQFNIEWYLPDSSKFNLTTTVRTIDKITLELPVYGILVRIDGYLATCIIPYTLVGQFIVSVGNTFGKTEEVFVLHPESYTFSLQLILWALSGIAIFVLTCVSTTFFVKLRLSSGIGLFHQTNSSRIYHAAPAAPNPELHLYQRTDPYYLELNNVDSNEQHIQTVEQETNEYEVVENIHTAEECSNEIDAI